MTILATNLFDNVFVPLVDHMIPTSITLPLEMLEAANTYAALDGYRKLAKFNVKFYAESSEVVNTLGVLKLNPDALFSNNAIASAILIPALWRNPLILMRKNLSLVNWIKKQYDQGATFVVAGTGVVFIAEAGLLTGKPATTHWYYLDKLQNAYPEINFKPNHLITKADRIYCAGSVNSVADLIVHLISEAYNKNIAIKVEQQFSHEIRRPFSDIYFSSDYNTVHTDEAIANLQSWLNTNYANNISNDLLCSKANMNMRTLNRRFKLATGYSPKKYILNMRLKQAKDLLKRTDLSIYEVSQAVGYFDAVYFAKLFKREYQLTPKEFRKSVREKLFKSQ